MYSYNIVLKISTIFTKLLCVAFIIISYSAKSQTPLNGDQHWILNTTVSDEFSYTGNHAQVISQLSNKWHFIENWGNKVVKHDPLWIEYIPHSYFTEDGSNIEVANGVCEIYGKYEPGSYPWPCLSCYGNGTGFYTMQNMLYTKGSLLHNIPTRFGYYEVSIRLPFYPKAQKEKVGGLGPNFWFFRESENTPLPYGYAEIDVYEQVDLSKSNKHSPYLFGPTIHFDANNADLGRIQNDVYGKIGWKEQTDTDVPLNYFVDFSDGQFHKIGFEWQKDYVTYYVDGKECGSINFEQDKIVAMNAYLDLNISPKSSDLTATVFPFKYEIDYFRYYQFATNSNPQPLTLTTGNYSNSTLGYTKRLNITIGGIGLQAKVQTGTSLTLRADEYILLDEGFEIDDETTMYMQVTTR